MWKAVIETKATVRNLFGLRYALAGGDSRVLTAFAPEAIPDTLIRLDVINRLILEHF